MKKITQICFLTIGLLACKNGADYKVIRQEVLDAHDKVMLDGEVAITNKMKLDTLGTSLDSLVKIKVISDTLVERQKITALQAELNHADEQMNDWMHNFKADLEGKSKDEAAIYFKTEKEKVQSLDSLYQEAIKASEAYLSKFKK
ncbi:hypothetical protein N180_01100 [Pedobacter antarcticus 4BY]|uniref:Viral A-type inclusion protein n=2 Tax=Pedobacter antarcticus TaxID=34086 RepID=A0A081PC38_9SPHI|nr:hypothetical protein [Pedobacter antarcticus]KEQ28261.1 hypothetical protein N180_01100 [Pedobacter antarcticus 4BY]SFE46978.1 hypothetical protein SAMN03003324_00586 [Pedobacter antarcticus]